MEVISSRLAMNKLMSECNVIWFYIFFFFFLITKVSSTSKEVNIIPILAVPKKYIVLTIKLVPVLLRNVPPVPTSIGVMAGTIKK